MPKKVVISPREPMCVIMLALFGINFLWLSADKVYFESTHKWQLDEVLMIKFCREYFIEKK